MNNRGSDVGGGGGINSHDDLYGKIISIHNLFTAWKEFKSGKIKKTDVSIFAFEQEEHLFKLHEKLKFHSYKHGYYTPFFIQDPKLRSIHKAEVIDRILHHAIVRVIEPIFEKIFIYDSYSSRKTKGTYKAGDRFREFAWKLSENNTKKVWILKCDIRKFFDSVDHEILLSVISEKVQDEKLLALLRMIITSFDFGTGKGIPLGNLTSQLFSNIYLNELDQFIKRELRVKYYIRYADDFVILSRDRESLLSLLPTINNYLNKELKLTLHSKKIILKNWNQGIDFLGIIHFPYHTILRTKTRNRIFKKMKLAKKKLERKSITPYQYNQIAQSYLGRLKHCRSRGIRRNLKEQKLIC